MGEKNISIIGNDCCGCGNCFYVCTKRAIALQQNDEGFFYPHVNKNCIECGACLNVCPQTKEIEKRNMPISFIALSMDTDIQAKAASGGVFGTISKRLLFDENTFVCTATFENGIVRHIITQSISDVKKSQGSKYVQSNLEDSFPRIKEILKEVGSKVLFCGTPCQVAALYAFLRTRPINLYTLDLICHGVPSPFFFKKNLNHYCKNISKLRDVRFRWRNPNYAQTKSYFFLSIEKNISKRIYSYAYDPYFAAFMRGESFRLSCYECHYANLHRVGDITIGDCDSAILYPNFHPNESKSTVLINTPQGNLLWSMVKDAFDFMDLDLKNEAEVNHQLSHPFEKPEARDNIYIDMKSLTSYQFRNKYARPISKQQKVLFTIQNFLPSLYRMIILKAVK